MPKVITSDVREIVLKIKEYFIKEKQNNGPLVPFRKIHERVAAATGVSLHTVSNIVKESNMAGTSCPKIKPEKKIRKDKILLDDFDLEVLRRKIREYYSVRKEKPSIKKLHLVLKEEMGFKGSREILRQHIKKIGFQFKKTNSNRKAIVRNNMTTCRTKSRSAIKRNEQTEKLPVIYLDETGSIHSDPKSGKCPQDNMKQNEQTENLPVIYLDELGNIRSSSKSGKCQQNNETDGAFESVSQEQRLINVLAGSEQEIVNNADLIFKSISKTGDNLDDMEHENLKKWVSENLSTNLNEPAVIITVMDNAPCPNTSVNKAPNSNSRKNDIMEWLTSCNIEFTPEMTKPQLLEIVKRHRPEPVYAVDAILRD